MSVDSSSWKKYPVAARETAFDYDSAVSRITQWANGDEKKYSSAFLFRNPNVEAHSPDAYRLPVIDIAEGGKPVLIPRAVFSAATILSGAHGGLEDVTTDDDRLELKAVVSDIYDMLREDYGDPRVVPPWLRGGNDPDQVQASVEEDMDFSDALLASVNSSGWASLPIADEDRQWTSADATGRVFAWADGNWRKYRRAFLWFDATKPELKGSYKLPIADVIDGELTIVPRAVNAVAAVLAGARGGVNIPDADMDRVEGIVKRIQARMHSGNSIEAATSWDAPSEDVFLPPIVNGPTPITITADGRLYGHAWLWNKCHQGIQSQCVMAPRSSSNYKYFLNGQVLTASGKQVRVGKITMGTGHAGPRTGWVPAADHYDNTGTQAAWVTITEDQYGGMMAGIATPMMSEEDIAVLRTSPISGDWRRTETGMELVAALAVNTPGFPIVASVNGEISTILAAGMVEACGDGEHTEVEACDECIEAGGCDTFLQAGNACSSCTTVEASTTAEACAIDRVNALDERIARLKQRGRGRIYEKIVKVGVK